MVQKFESERVGYWWYVLNSQEMLIRKRDGFNRASVEDCVDGYAGSTHVLVCPRGVVIFEQRCLDAGLFIHGAPLHEATARHRNRT